MIAPDALPDMSSQDDQAEPGCDLVEQLQGRWTLRILLCLNAGPHRFSDLRTAIPEVAANVLTNRLRALQSAGLIERRYLPPPAASHVYALESSRGLKPVLDALASCEAQASDIPDCAQSIKEDDE